VIDPHEVLGLPPGASRDQVEKAYRFCLDLYADASLATYSLLDPAEARDARQRVQEAYEALRPLEPPPLAPIVEEARPPAPPAAPAMPAPPALPAAPLAVAETRQTLPSPPAAPRILPLPVTGEALRRCREDRGISLRDIANVTKVGLRYLEYIEADRHPMLPAAVYLRGFLQQYAVMVGLDPRATAEAYLSRLRPE
jgi:hypothetical protein